MKVTTSVSEVALGNLTGVHKLYQDWYFLSQVTRSAGFKNVEVEHFFIGDTKISHCKKHGYREGSSMKAIRTTNLPH